MTASFATILRDAAQGAAPQDDDLACGAHVSSLQRRQQSGHQAAALGQTVDLDVFVERMRVGAANAQAIQRRDSHRWMAWAFAAPTRIRSTNTSRSTVWPSAAA